MGVLHMSITIGFVVLTHERLGQVSRLVHRLNRMFHNPPIAWHHDPINFTLSIDEVPSNVSLVLPPLKSEWARFPIVEATACAIKLLYQRPDAPDWFVVLS